MSNNYLIVLFKNKKKRKIIKRYSTEKNARKKFNDLLKDNEKVLFEKSVENATPCNYELSLLTNKTKIQSTIFITDELGRNQMVDLDSADYIFLEIKKYKIEETIFDWQTQSKISVKEMISKYMKKKDLKSVYTLNNKICVQIDDDVSIFSLKDKDESDRLLFTIENYFIENGRNDAFFTRDISLAQRKWIYKILEGKGFDKKRLYRLKTTFSKR
jgi:hypothetical protein